MFVQKNAAEFSLQKSTTTSIVSFQSDPDFQISVNTTSIAVTQIPNCRNVSQAVRGDTKLPLWPRQESPNKNEVIVGCFSPINQQLDIYGIYFGLPLPFEQWPILSIGSYVDATAPIFGKLPTLTFAWVK